MVVTSTSRMGFLSLVAPKRRFPEPSTTGKITLGGWFAEFGDEDLEAWAKEGREPASRLFASIFGSGRNFDLLPTRANGQPALGAYVRDATGIGRGVGLFVLTLSGDRICAMTRFESGVLPWFGLPRSLPHPSSGINERSVLEWR